MARSSSSVFLSSFALSRAVLNEAAMTCRSRSESGPGILLPTTAPTPAAAALLLPIVLTVRANLQKINIGSRRLRPAHGVVVRRARIVRDDVTCGHMLILEHEGVSPRKYLRITFPEDA